MTQDSNDDFEALFGFPDKATKVIGIGKAYTWNYPGEVAPDPLPEPLVFLRPPSSLLPLGRAVEVPGGSALAYEVELAIVIGKRGKDIKLKDAESHIGGYALALDMCASDIHEHAKENGLPWAICKGMDTFSPIGRFIAPKEIPDPENVNLKLVINGQAVTDSSTSKLIYSISQEIAFVSTIMTLQPGDIILTGAPEGVSTVEPGSKMVATLGLPDGKVMDELEVDVVQRKGGYQFGRHWTEWLE